MPHTKVTFEDRLAAIAKHCAEEEYIITFGYDPQAEKWFSSICDMRTEEGVTDFADDDLDGAVSAMEAHLEL